jgi:uncharacterized phage protein gp47/JayE
MALPPLFNPPGGGTPAQEITYSTNLRNQFLTGILQGDVVEVQVSINRGAFTADPDFVVFDIGTFTIPNVAVFPEGLPLNRGINTIQARIIDTGGGVSSPATATITYLLASEVEASVTPPTGIRIERRRNSVELQWTKNEEDTVIGYNVYASTESGGGTTGYFRINKDLVADEAFSESDTTEISSDTSTFTNENAQLHTLITQENFSGGVIGTVADNYQNLSLQPESLQVTILTEEIVTTTFYSFSHNRQGSESDGFINNDQFAGLPDTEPLYYVITAVVFDPTLNEEVESVFSSELVGLPYIISTQIQDLIPRRRRDVTVDYVTGVRKANKTISLIPGSFTRDVAIDPFSSEIERVAFLQDFIQRSSSFLTLLAVDDADEDGISDLVATSAYKTALKAALGFTSDDAVQQLIDDQFDKLAGNANITRGGATRAIGQVTFYVLSKPTTSLVVEEGTTVATETGVQYRVTSRVIMTVADIESFFNPAEQRYEISANIQAINAGEAGTVGSNTINRIVSGASGFQVTNPEATRFGFDQETNTRLAERAMLAFVSVDAGTEGGYTATALREQGVERVRVILAGERLMMRDYDDVRDKHIGGKVDVWLQGLEEITVQDTFAFTFDVVNDALFLLIDPINLIFEAQDSRLSESNPIIEMLENHSQGLGLRNVSTGNWFDLTNVTITAFNRIQLDTTIPQPAVDFADIVRGDYRLSTGNDFFFTRQPVRSVGSVSGELSGALTDGTNYELWKTEDPLLLGESTLANNFLRVTSVGGVPSGATINVNDEQHVLVGENTVNLEKLGVNTYTVAVFNQARTVTYVLGTDYTVTTGDQVTPASIARIAGGAIADGETVSVDYEHDENFVVTYSINNLLRRVQEKIDEQRHATADVVVKQAVENPVDLEVTVVLTQGANQSTVDAQIRTSLSTLLNNKAVGQDVFQSDVIHAIEEVDGVQYVVVPLRKMARSDDGTVVREELVSNFTELPDLSTGTSSVYLNDDEFRSATSDTGGPENFHRGIFMNDLVVEMVDTIPKVSLGSGRGYIIGNQGASLLGYSDDTTLEAEGFDTAEEREAERIRRTANRALISMAPADIPSDQAWAVTYVVEGDEGVGDLEASEVEFLSLGNLTITFTTLEQSLSNIS